MVKQQGDTVVRLEDVADVVLGAEDCDTSVRYSGQTAVFTGIFPLPDANTIDVIQRVKVEIEAIERELPTGLEASIGYDASESIASAVREVTKTLGETSPIVISGRSSR